ncbi:hypothetical protein [Paracraurococcus lichenis]|uniref:Uncharacterized protein n=1 Tax=Paracraurococcus lichenis TaxID=3064888 RepID=A0ABT9E6G8_9PROT|nr:hypothetical protein [Paracraurococcus sp. LOR1-02]MDO9711772.1 hypothetical protein [Paracraurococcus sp. LOR1-02]
MAESGPGHATLGDLQCLLEEGVGVIHAVQAEQAGQRREIASLELAIVALTAVVGELVAARRADHEVLRRILEACTREASGELQEALRHMAAAIADMGRDVRAILVAVEPRPPPG